jgi:hypothetical protein
MLRIHFVKTTVVDIIIKLDMPLTAVTTMLLVQILLVHIRVPVTLAFTVLVNHVPRVHHAVPDLQKQQPVLHQLILYVHKIFVRVTKVSRQLVQLVLPLQVISVHLVTVVITWLALHVLLTKEVVTMVQ